MDDFILVDILPQEVLDVYTKLRNTFKHWLPTLNDRQLDIAVSIAVGVCPYCSEEPIGCQCSNDE